MIKVIIADDHQIFIEGLKTVLRLSKGQKFDVVGEAQSGKDLLHLLRAVDSDVLFLDLNMPDGDGLEILPEVRRVYPELKVIILTMFEDTKIVKTAFKSGADAFILKGNSIEEIYEAVEDVLTGSRYVGKSIAFSAIPAATSSKKRLEAPHFQDRFMQKYNLTAREIEILQLITQALSNKEIAKSLFISDQTVSVHRKNIMRKLGVSNTAALLKLAFDNNLV
jgi:DNA-binding NarL/FixJ family response regulator